MMLSDLFEPVQLGASRLANRIVMAPLTRSRGRADPSLPGGRACSSGFKCGLSRDNRGDS